MIGVGLLRRIRNLSWYHWLMLPPVALFACGAFLFLAPGLLLFLIAGAAVEIYNQLSA